MLEYPQIDPVAVSLGPVQIHWYGLSYLLGILLAWWVLRYRAKTGGFDMKPEEVDDLIFYATMGIVIGGRLGYCLFYKPAQVLADPLWLFKVWEGGMSFHGGFLGVTIATILFSRRFHKSWWALTDQLACVTPIGLALGRLANFINGELYGRVSDAPWSMVFPGAGELPRHPSQLYEMFLSGVMMFVLINLLYFTKPAERVLTGAFVLMYGLQRFTVEFFRQPDAHLNYIFFDWVTMGQLLSIPMILAGILIINSAKSNEATT